MPNEPIDAINREPIWKVALFANKQCKDVGKEIAPTMSIREKLRNEILELSNEQAEYVLRRLLNESISHQ